MKRYPLGDGLQIPNFGAIAKEARYQMVTQINQRLLEKLLCPVCHEGTFRKTQQDMLICEACKRQFPIIRGIADLTYFPESREEAIDFNNIQAQHERQFHDSRAQDNYEEHVIQKFGDKTDAIATGWAKGFPDPILDFGCGTGQVCRFLRKYHAEVYGFDISPISVEQNVKDNGTLAVVANAFCVPFKDGTFETVCCNGTLHHIVDLKRVIDEMARVCKKYIVISEPCAYSYHPMRLRIKRRLRIAAKSLLKFFGLLEITKGMYKICSSCGAVSKYERPLDPKDIVELFKQAGFKVTQLSFWTNLNWRRRSRLKKLLIRMMVSKRVGTHFEIHAERDEDSHSNTSISP